jgi:hypothetical protein
MSDGQRQALDYSQATYTEAPSQNPYEDLDKVVTVFKGGSQVFSADPARVVTSDAPGDCTNLLRVEVLGAGCTFRCEVYCSPVR